jgi:diaminohydroxyphosphoribosylaminopyrimidine deaminase/5-amino-6-(5-phosphoribosylamino)uracil reductase
MDYQNDDIRYMRRALQLARYGAGHVSPNPMVGCVIVDAQGLIIGEGWHRRFGEGHAEVNAMASVRDEDKPRLKGATLYVTLEPCSHYGKTPPCADMVARSEIARVVVGMQDPNPKVSGRGNGKLLAAGKSVTVGVLEEECRELNKRFITAQVEHRPYVTLKWARDAKGDMGFRNPQEGERTIYSNPLSLMWMHRCRSLHDAIMVGERTAAIDNPSLTVRYWVGNNPRKIILSHTDDLTAMLHDLWQEGVSSLLVEGGARLLQAFIDARLYDEIREEINYHELPGDLPAPVTNDPIVNKMRVRSNEILLKRVKKL